MQKTLIFNDDGWSTYMRYPAPMAPEDIVRATVLPLVGSGVKIYQFCSLGSHAVNYRSDFLPLVGEWMKSKTGIDKIHVWRIRATIEYLASQGTDPLKIVQKACQEHGIECHYSLRMNDGHHTYVRADGSQEYPELFSDWLDNNRSLRLPSGRLNYACKEVRDYRRKQVEDVLGRYPVDGIDLDFTRKRPWFLAGEEVKNAPVMTAFIRELSVRVRAKGRKFTARFEHDPQMMLQSGLDVSAWLEEGLFDHITLGTLGDHWPDPPVDWWVKRAKASGCLVCPGIEGQVYQLKTTVGGGTGTHASQDAMHDGYGPPSLEYMRAFAARAYKLGADGISLFNFTCCDGEYSRAALTELASEELLQFRPKQYVLAPWWPADEIRIYWSLFLSHVRLDPAQMETQREFLIADDMEEARRLNLERPSVLTLEMKNLNRIDDVEFILNGLKLCWNGHHYNHFDHGCWIDVIKFSVPLGVLQTGQNTLTLRRTKENAGFAGAVELRKFILDQAFATGFSPGRLL
ncbi:MAG: hypothetical protein JW384_01076 [Nitrosomonadaceae bacterium]|nr:hypothetical protein [Nitrosomonadaceae bacterium]